VAENCPKLLSLNLEHCSNITNVGIFKIVACCTRIKNLNMYGCNVTEESMHIILDNDGDGSDDEADFIDYFED
jgi:hypothetical protein